MVVILETEFHTFEMYLLFHILFTLIQKILHYNSHLRHYYYTFYLPRFYLYFKNASSSSQTF